jgi:hypothetical protein
VDLYLDYRCAELAIEKGFTHYYEIPRPVQERFMFPTGLLVVPQKRIVLANSLILGSSIPDVINAAEKISELKAEVLASNVSWLIQQDR